MSTGLLYYFGAFIISTVLSAIYMRRWRINFGASLTLFYVLTTVSNLGYFLLATSTELKEALLANKITYLGGCFVIPVFMLVIMHLCKINVSGRVSLLMALTGGVIFAGVLTIGHSDLYYGDCTVEIINGVCVLRKVYGPLHTAYFLFLLAYTLFGIGLLIYVRFKRRDVSTQTVYVLLIAEFSAILAYFGGRFVGAEYELTPVSYIVTQLLLLIQSDRIALYDIDNTVMAAVVEKGIFPYIGIDQHGRYLGCNDAAAKLFPELAEIKVDAPIPKGSELFELMQKQFQTYQGGKQPEMVMFSRGDRSYMMDMHSMYIRKRLRGFHFVFADSTMEQNYIRQLQEEREKANRASEAKSVFLYNMSHEIRTPINAILGMDEILIRESDDEATLNRARDIRVAGSTLLEIVNDILDLSKIEAGKLEIIPGEYDLRELLRGLILMIGTRAESKGLEFRVDIDPEIPAILYGDEVRIRQCITNLLTNAVKYTDTGSVTLSLSFEQDGADNIRLGVAVSDTGIGIREEDLSKLFMEFQRLDERRNRNVEGTGLGMSITRELLELMGSDLEVESKYGSGSTFSFRIRQRVLRKDSVGSADSLVMEQRPAASGQKYAPGFTAPEASVLVVDDTYMNLVVIEGLLKPTRIKIETVTSGEEALERVQHTHYDLILLDHRMPVMDGIETLKRMKELKHHQCPEAPVIALTANAISGAKEQYLRAGFTDYMSKPVEPEKLEDMIRHYLPEELIHAVKKDLLPVFDDKADKTEIRPDVKCLEEKVSSLNVDLGIRNCGSEKGYLNACGIFCQAVKDNEAGIRDALDRQDFEKYTILVHALKSSARMIGAEEVSSTALVLEGAGERQDEATIVSLTPWLLKKYVELGSDLEKALSYLQQQKQPSEDLVRISESDYQNALHLMEAAASGMDYDGVQDMLNMLEDDRLTAEQETQIKEVKTALDHLEWDRITEILK